jgi:hypothetical protein
MAQEPTGELKVNGADRRVVGSAHPTVEGAADRSVCSSVPLTRGKASSVRSRVQAISQTITQ